MQIFTKDSRQPCELETNSSDTTNLSEANSNSTREYESNDFQIDPSISNSDTNQSLNSSTSSTPRSNCVRTNSVPQQQQPALGLAHVVLASIHSLHPQLDLKLNSRCMLMPVNDQIRELQTVIRDKTTTRGNFKFYADRLIRLVVEEGLNQLPTERVEVKTPTGHNYKGIRYLKGNCGVSIVRSGECMEQGLRDCCRSIRIGKILIEQDDNNQARVCYTKFPKDIEHRRVLVLYPIMSTGLAVVESIKVLLRQGVKEDHLILLNLFSSPKACKMINILFPRICLLTSDINPICPNHFGQRYFGTD